MTRSKLAFDSFIPAKYGLGYSLRVNTKCFISSLIEIESRDGYRKKEKFDLYSLKFGQEVIFPVPKLAPKPVEEKITFEFLFNRGFSIRDVLEYRCSFKQWIKMGLTLNMILENDFHVPELESYNIFLGDLFKLMEMAAAEAGDSNFLNELAGGETRSMMMREEMKRRMTMMLHEMEEQIKKEREEAMGELAGTIGDLFKEVASQGRYISPACNCLLNMGVCLCNLPFEETDNVVVNKALIKYLEEAIYPEKIEEPDGVAEEQPRKSVKKSIEEIATLMDVETPMDEVKKQLSNMCEDCQNIMVDLLKVLKLPRKVVMNLDFSGDDLLKSKNKSCMSACCSMNSKTSTTNQKRESVRQSQQGSKLSTNNSISSSS